MKITEFKIEIKRLISKNEIDTALKMLDNNLNPNSFLYDELIIFQGKFSEVSKEARKGIISRENRELEVSIIRSGLLDLLNSVEENDLTSFHNEVISGSKLPEMSKEYNIMLESYVKENKRLQVNIDELRKELEFLKASNPIIKLKNTVQMYNSLLGRFYGIINPLNSILNGIKEDEKNIDIGFALSQIDNICRNIESLSAIVRILEVLKGIFNESKKNVGEKKNRAKEIYLSLASYCLYYLILDEKSIEKTLAKLQEVLLIAEEI